MKTKKTLISIITLCAALSLTACNGSGSATTENSQKPRQNLPLKLWTIPTQSWMIYISRRTRYLQITRMYGTRHLAWRIKAMLIQAEIMPIIWPA